jgi:hypothetical protein
MIEGLEMLWWLDMIILFLLYTKGVFHHLSHIEQFSQMIVFEVFHLATPHCETFCIKSKRIQSI